MTQADLQRRFPPGTRVTAAACICCKPVKTVVTHHDPSDGAIWVESSVDGAICYHVDYLRLYQRYRPGYLTHDILRKNLTEVD